MCQGAFPDQGAPVQAHVKAIKHLRKRKLNHNKDPRQQREHGKRNLAAKTKRHGDNCHQQTNNGRTAMGQKDG